MNFYPLFCSSAPEIECNFRERDEVVRMTRSALLVSVGSVSTILPAMQVYVPLFSLSPLPSFPTLIDGSPIGVSSLIYPL